MFWVCALAAYLAYWIAAYEADRHRHEAAVVRMTDDPDWPLYCWGVDTGAQAGIAETRFYVGSAAAARMYARLYNPTGESDSPAGKSEGARRSNTEVLSENRLLFGDMPDKALEYVKGIDKDAWCDAREKHLSSIFGGLWGMLEFTLVAMVAVLVGFGCARVATRFGKPVLGGSLVTHIVLLIAALSCCVALQSRIISA